MAADPFTRDAWATTSAVIRWLLDSDPSIRWQVLQELTDAPATVVEAERPEVTAARLRVQEYLLERRLFRRKSTGEAIERDRKGGASWQGGVFRIIGWMTVVTSLALLVTPWRWHHRVGQRVMPLMLRHMRLYTIGLMAFGILLLLGVSRAKERAAACSTATSPTAWEA